MISDQDLWIELTILPSDLVYTATFSAAIVLFMDLFHAIDQDLPELVVQEV